MHCSMQPPARSSLQGYEPPPLLRRVRLQLQRNGPRLQAAVTQSVADCRDWVVAGGTIRILLALAVSSLPTAAFDIECPSCSLSCLPASRAPVLIDIPSSLLPAP